MLLLCTRTPANFSQHLVRCVIFNNNYMLMYCPSFSVTLRGCLQAYILHMSTKLEKEIITSICSALSKLLSGTMGRWPCGIGPLWTDLTKKCEFGVHVFWRGSSVWASARD
jgi:hypothetical protein